jgi:hypothetical protein
VRPARNRPTLGWTKARKVMFLRLLTETCNVREAAERVGMTRDGAYSRRRTDPEFGRDWQVAIEAGFAELEIRLLGQALSGSRRVEEIIDPDTGQVLQIKRIRTDPSIGEGTRLLAMHRQEVERFRAMEAARQGKDTRIVETIAAEMARVRLRLGFIDEDGEAHAEGRSDEQLGD